MNRSLLSSTPAGRLWHDVAYWGIMLVACAVFYYMNLLTPFLEDDMAFALLGKGTWIDLISSQWDHYLTSNGRCSDALATVFCAYLGKPFFNVCNTLVFGLMAHLLSLLSTQRRSVTVLAFFLAVVGWCYPLPGQTLLFVAGACNYMWAVTASLLLVYYLQRAHDKPLGWGKGVLLFVAAMLAGNLNEGTSFGFLAGLICYYIVNRKLVNRRVIVAMAGYMLGVLIIVASPAAWTRAAAGDIVVNMGPVDLFVSRFRILAIKAYHFIVPVTALAVGLVALFRCGFGVVLHNLWTWVFLFLLSVMFVLGIQHDRAYAALVTVAFIVTAMGLDAVLPQRWTWLRVVAIVALLAMTVLADARALKVMRAYKDYGDRTVSEIVAAPREAVLHERHFNGFSRFVTPLCYASSDFFVRKDLYCEYFDKDNVQFVSDSIYDRYHTGRLLVGAVPLPVHSDRPDLVDTLLCFPDQDYAIAPFHVDTLPNIYQQARYYEIPLEENVDGSRVFKNHYGVEIDHRPSGFYPLRYNSRLLLVFPQFGDSVTAVVFPVNGQLPLDEVTLTITRK